MAWTGKASDDEIKKVLCAIDVLEQRPFIKHMSYDLIAKTTYTLKPTAVRWIIPEVVNAGYAIQLTVGDQKVPRYFYKLTDTGKALIGKA
jgi:hypothetical protein